MNQNNDSDIMTVTVDVSISDNLISEIAESDDDVPEPGLIQTWAAAAYLNDVPAVASIHIATSEEIQQLNKQYRDKDKPTNVLSFPMQSPEEVDVCLLGDIALCASVIKQEAIQQSKPEISHWAHMVVHGMLHLQGYDHIKDDEAEKMEQLEVKVLKQLGFSNPYK